MTRNPVAGQYHMRSRLLLVAFLILAIFVLWQSLFPPHFVGFATKHAIFSSNYREYGLTANSLLPSYNLALTDPPSNVYLSKPPLVPLIMYVSSSLFGDSPAVFLNTMVLLNCIFFASLAGLVARRWGIQAGFWALIFGAWSLYALHYGDEQTFEQLSTLGMFASIYFYFEYVEVRRTFLVVLSVLCYFVGLMADYLAFFAAFVICFHWLLSVRSRRIKDLMLIGLYPLSTLVLILLMIGLMLLSDVSLGSWFDRAGARMENVSPFAFIKAWGAYPILLLGPHVVAATFLLPALRRRFPTALIWKQTDTQLIFSLLAMGLLPLLIFREAYLAHPFWIVFLVPFFVTAASLSATVCWQLLMSRPTRQRLLPLVILGLCSVLAANMVFDYVFLEGSSSNQKQHRVQVLALSIKHRVESPQSLLILDGDEDIKVTLFYTLRVPTQRCALIECDLLPGQHRIVFTTSEAGSVFVKQKCPDAEILAQDHEMIFFRLPDGTVSSEPSAKEVP